tara:strand:- start:943 stop:1242 length:300 start_codon:yes stop_codon:yes gene_type:complete
MKDEDTVLTPVRIITGAVYERARGPEVEQVVCIARITENGKIRGLFRRYGMTYERYDETTEEMMSWTLIWSPDGSHEPKKVAKKVTKKSPRATKVAEAK